MITGKYNEESLPGHKSRCLVSKILPVLSPTFVLYFVAAESGASRNSWSESKPVLLSSVIALIDGKVSCLDFVFFCIVLFCLVVTSSTSVFKTGKSTNEIVKVSLMINEMYYMKFLSKVVEHH